jgi:hypothetical protein
MRCPVAGAGGKPITRGHAPLWRSAPAARYKLARPGAHRGKRAIAAAQRSELRQGIEPAAARKSFGCMAQRHPDRHAVTLA